MIISLDCASTLAVTELKENLADAQIAVTRFEVAIARGLIVLPLNQSLNASGVDTTTSQGQ
jgi:hypothetical protein